MLKNIALYTVGAIIVTTEKTVETVKSIKNNNIKNEAKAHFKSFNKKAKIAVKSKKDQEIELLKQRIYEMENPL
jgi:hypothetical protein